MKGPASDRLRDGGLSGGHYAKKQLECSVGLISYGHRSRYAMARRLVTPHQGTRLLDYGCGDGTFIALVADLFPELVGVDIDPDQTKGCAARLGHLAGVKFRVVGELQSPSHDGSFDVVTCMETLEHCPARELEIVLSDLRRLVAREGRVYISVPIEIGPPLLVKEAARTLAALRGESDYVQREKYTVRELGRMVTATRRTAIERPIYGSSHLHKGFNWRWLREHLKGRFDVRRTLFSPLPWSRGFASSQAWFECAPRIT